ncbi:UDP-glucuronic acid decarboxylase family protein [Actinomadura algeriensis]|uniref:dTDP-glucose 4,6-dehydratase n=1 Tax=Actinomadura algeriensis TaxID=1679523 RepID=A0ABR9JK30_9ACTN|nr:UDP-glucuronic acid decarboxylase family protein [Actinomadura algeriensis]MBE1530490.1 dTDP-glucose 4,6-dehydratase [Actinomadura algeriensis]
MAEKVMVTGGAGFVGSHLCERLLADGFEVVCVDDLSTGRAENVARLTDTGRFRFVECDAAECEDPGGDLAAVLHFASPASPVDYLRLPIETLMVGSAGTRRMLDVARAHGARFLLASTSEVYGDALVHPQPESYWGNVNPVGPRSVYDEAKRFGEALTTAYRTTYGVRTGIVRLFNTYGPRMRRGDGRVIPAFINQALRGVPLTLAGDGRQTRSLCYIDDMVEGVLRMMRSAHAGPCNLGSTHEISMVELAELIRDLIGSGSVIENVPRMADDPQVRRPDTSLARAVLGWEPRVPLAEGLLRTVEWFAAPEPGEAGAPIPDAGQVPPS